MSANDTLKKYYEDALIHQKEHRCTGVPYDQADLLRFLVALHNPLRILELGTGIGFSTACFALGNPQVEIDSIDQNPEHGKIAKRMWKNLHIDQQIRQYLGKAEVILPTLSESYDMIFFDGNAPSMKFLIHFQRLLKKGGLLITANLFLKDPKGGAYLRNLHRGNRWQNYLLEDTALSIKLR